MCIRDSHEGQAYIFPERHACTISERILGACSFLEKFEIGSVYLSRKNLMGVFFYRILIVLMQKLKHVDYRNPLILGHGLAGAGLFHWVCHAKCEGRTVCN